MKQNNVEVICGSGLGKTALAVGKGVIALTRQQNVIMIQFLKGSQKQEGLDALKCMEPRFKVFRFEKADMYFENLTEEERQEELINIRNGFNFAKKVVATRGCDLLILDEILGVLEKNIIAFEDFEKLITGKEEGMGLILTGRVFPQELRSYVDAVSSINYIEVDKDNQEC
ncbi:MAG: cob(I)yrinic acid a c-diamide adenosyltransferase [Hungatella sp.]|nr:cob(I)yrinic acid a c-diamide adenosyltransferase [Hungatella sp.]